ncbi:hypothetical protein GCM10027408_07210 [Microbacterium tumbae]
MTVLTGCAATVEDPALPSAAGPSAGIVSPESTPMPAPGRTIEATPPPADELSGYRIAVVVPDGSAGSRALLEGIRAFAASSGADLEEFPAVEGDDPVGAAFEAAVDEEPDLLVGLGEGVADVFNYETPKLLSQQILIVGAQLFEPTANVTAVIWEGATSRGSEVGPDGPLDPASVTAQRGADALAAGVASVREGVTGVVLHLGDHSF